MIFFYQPIFAQTTEEFLAELKKNVLESQYIFTSEISQVTNHEVISGEKIFLTNRVSRERFRVAGKPVTVFFNHPQTIEPITGLKSSYLGMSNTQIYQDLTDERGELVIAFTPQQNNQRLEIDIHFINVPKNYTEHINRIDLRVYNPQKIETGYYSLPLLWGILFLIVFLIGLTIRLIPYLQFLSHPWFPVLSSFLTFLRGLADLFPYLILLLPPSSVKVKEIFLRQVILILTGLMIAFLLQTDPAFLLSITVLGILFFRQRMIPVMLLMGLLLLSHFFLGEFYSLQSLPEYIGREEIAILILITFVATSPSLLAGVAMSAWLQHLGVMPDLFSFLVNPSFEEWFSSISFSNLSEFYKAFLVRDYFFLFLLSITLTGFTIGYRFLSQNNHDGGDG